MFLLVNTCKMRDGFYFVQVYTIFSGNIFIMHSCVVIMSKKLSFSFMYSIHIYVCVKKEGFLLIEATTTVDNVPFVKQDHCFSNTKFFVRIQKKTVQN